MLKAYESVGSATFVYKCRRNNYCQSPIEEALPRSHETYSDVILCDNSYVSAVVFMSL